MSFDPASEQQPGFGQPGYPGTGYGVPAYGPPPPSYLIWARIAAVGGVLFNLILGLPAALVATSYARKVRQHWETGNAQAALSASKTARTWAIIATVLDVLGIVLLVVILTQSSSSGSNFNNPSVLAASIKTQLQKRISDPSSTYYSPGLKVTSVVCKPIRTNTDRCTDHFSNGETSSEIAVISDHGERYLTH
ncbi:MAG TPA: CD225/dispanin family protein [Streptosporangiaceae bacterium]|nr:CD225/dispanin family protein [Streptosporangiaceae bacterium]